MTTAVFRAYPIVTRRRRLVVVLLVGLFLLIAAAGRWLWRKLRPRVTVTPGAPRDITVPITVSRLCKRPSCQNYVSGNAVYCSHACRQWAYRERQKAAA
jgi:hypothetical protein